MEKLFSNERWKIWALGLFFVIVTHLMIGNYTARIANGNSDNTPTVYVNYFQNPLRYQGDVLETFAYQLTWASIMNWSSVLVNKWFSIPSEIPTTIFLFIQNAVLALGFFFFVRQIIPNKKHPALFLVPIALYLATPWWWNISWYPNMTYIPYAGHLAAPFLVFAGGAWLSGQFGILAGCLALAALIHPSQTIHLMSILGIDLLLRHKLKFNRAPKEIACFVVVGLLCVVPPLLLVRPGFNPVTNTEIMPTILANKHFVPWQNDGFWSWEIPSTIGIALMGMWVARRLSFIQERHRTFIYSNVLALIALSILHLVALKLQWVQVIQLCPLRVSVLTALFLAPFVFTYYVEKAKDGNSGTRWVAAASFLFHAAFSYGFYWFSWLTLELAERKKNSKLPAVLFGVWCTVFLVLIRFLAGTPLEQFASRARLFWGPGIMNGCTATTFVFYLVSTGIITFIYSKKPQVSFALLLALVSGVLLVKSKSSGDATETGFIKANLLAQEWALNNTAESAIFIKDGHPWRPISQRRAIDIRCEGMHMYTRHRQTKNFCDEVTAFYAAEGLEKSSGVLNHDQIVKFIKKYGGDYVVRYTDQPKLSFPEAYRNSDLVIYKVTF